MIQSDEALRDAYRLATERPARRRQDCPSADSLWSIAVGEVDAAQRATAVAHVARCAPCARELALLIEAVPAAPEGRTAAAPRRPSWARLLFSLPRPAMAALAMFAAMAVTVVVLKDRLGTPASQTRGAAVPETSVVPPTGMTIPAPPGELVWEAWSSEEDGPWIVSLYDLESTLMWRSEPTALRRAALPYSVRSRMGATTYYWRVSRTDDGPSSPLFEFRVQSRR